MLEPDVMALLYPLLPGVRKISLCRSGQALAPFLRVPGGVKHRVDCYRRFGVFEKDGVSKSSYQAATVRLVNERIDEGLAADALNTRIERTEELLAHTHLAGFIPR